MDFAKEFGGQVNTRSLRMNTMLIINELNNSKRKKTNSKSV